MKLTDKNRLSIKNPELSKQWHPTLNGDLTTDDVSFSSHKKVWWICSKNHEWCSTINDRNNKSSGCPFCSGNKVCDNNSLATLNPELAKEWHPIKNKKLTPDDFTLSSGIKVWWQCLINPNHEWISPINNRKKGSGCPFCHSSTSTLELRIYTELKYFFSNIKHRFKIDKKECDIFIPELKFALEYDSLYYHIDKDLKDLSKNIHFKNNNINLLRVRDFNMEKLSESDIILNKKYEIVDVIINILDYLKNNYKLSEDILEKINTYKEKGELINNDEFINLQDMLSGCVEKGKSLGDLYPHLIKEWDFEKNGTLTPFNVSYGSDKMVWWICSKNHKWKAKVFQRSHGINCPYCSGKRICKDNCLTTMNPELAKQWHPILNDDLTPNDVTCGSNIKVWWICSKGHEWKAEINSRNYGNDCPYCSNQKVCLDNCLTTMNPELAKEWHPTLNCNLTPNDVTIGSSKKVWWFCSKGHEYYSIINDRNKGCGCRKCYDEKRNKK